MKTDIKIGSRVKRKDKRETQSKGTVLKFKNEKFRSFVKGKFGKEITRKKAHVHWDKQGGSRKKFSLKTWVLVSSIKLVK